MGSIRFLLALSVILVHAGSLFGVNLLPGFVAVESFYIISGFYMAMVYREKYIRSTQPVNDFLVNRFLRLYPLYLLVVLMTIAFSLAMGWWRGSFGQLQFYMDHAAAYPSNFSSLVFLGVSNLTLLCQDWITFFSFDAEGQLRFTGLQQEMTVQPFLFVPIAWTVAVEMFFYLFVPWLARFAKPWRVLTALALALAVRALLWQLFEVRDGFAVYRFAPTEFFWFLLGMLSYYLYHHRLFPRGRFGMPGLVLILLLIFGYPWHDQPWLVFGAVFLFTPAIFYQTAGWKWDRLLGEMTYPMYISHTFFYLIVMANHFPRPYGTALPLVVITLAFSLLVYYGMIRPMERLRANRLVAHSRT
ncbi:MAG: acyltransferase [Cyclobacteriaceae bacterium]